MSNYISNGGSVANGSYGSYIENHGGPATGIYNNYIEDNNFTSFSQSLFWDGGIRVPGISPPSTPPNDYLTSGIYQFGIYGSINFFNRLHGTTSAAYIDVEAVNFQSSLPIVMVRIDGVYYTDINYSSFSLGIKNTLRLNLPNDGLTHVIDLEEYSSITNVIGAVNWISPTPPQKRIVLTGDSFTAGYSADHFDTGYSAQVRYGLPSNYGTVIKGLPGTLMPATGFPGISTFCNGTISNLVCALFYANNYVQGYTQAQSLSDQTAYINYIQSTCPAGTKILLISPPQITAIPNPGGATQAQLAANMAGAVVPGSVEFLDLSALYPGSPPYSAYLSADGLHPTQAGHNLIYTQVFNKILAIT